MRSTTLAALFIALLAAAAVATTEDPADTAKPVDAPAAPAISLPDTPPPPDPDWDRSRYLPKTPPPLTGFTPAKVAPHPVIVILVDALRPDHLSMHGYPRDTTPHLDAFAREGVSFSQAYVNAPWTRPSTTTILTGLVPSRHLVECEQHKLDPAFVTLPEALVKAGYRTAGFVGNGNGAGIAGLDQGFQHYQDTKFFKGLPTAAQVVDETLGWLGKNKKRKRLFAFLFVVDPHDPYHGPTPEAEARWLWKGHPEIVRVPRWEYAPDKEPTVDQRRAMIAAYDSAVRYTDEQLGRMFEGLRKLGLYEKSTIIITADHGDGFGEHKFYKHAHHLWEEVVRVPLLVRSPVIPEAARGTSVATLAQAVDLYPTILAIARGKTARRLPGTSLFELMERPEAHASRVAFSEYNCFGISRYMIASSQAKLVLQRAADEEEFMRTVTRKDLLPSVIFEGEELIAFDLTADPLERKNLVPKKDPAALPAAYAPLMKQLREHIATRPSGEGVLADELDPDTEANLRALGYIQ